MITGRNAGKLAVKFLSLILCISLTTGIALSLQNQFVRADGTVEVGVSQIVDADHGIIYINSWGFDSNVQSISLVIDVNHSVDSVYEPWQSNSALKSYSVTGDGQQISVSVAPGQWVALEIGSVNCSDLAVSISSYSLVYSSTPTPTPEPTPTSTPTPTPTAKPTAEPTPTAKPTATPTVAPTATPTVAPTAAPTAKPTSAPADNNSSSGSGSGSGNTNQPANNDSNNNAPAPAAGGDVAATTAAAGEPAATTVAANTTETVEETTNPTETAEADDTLVAGETQETIMSVVGEVKEGETYDQTIVLDETHEDGSPVVMGLNSTTQEELNAAKARKQTMTTWFWIIFVILLAGASYFRYRYLKEKKGYRGSEIAINFIPGTSDLIYAIGYHFNLPGRGKGKEAIPSDASATPVFNTASAMKELKKMESDEVKAEKPERKPSTPSVPHKRPKELSVNHAAAVAAAAKTAESAPAFKPSVKPAESSVKPTATAAATSAAVIAARERAEAAKEQQRMREEAQKSKTNEAKLAEIKQRPPIKRPAALSVNHAAAVKAESESASGTQETAAKTDKNAEQNNSPFKPLDRSHEREIYSTPGLRPRKSSEDYHKMAPGATQLGKAVSAQQPTAPYARGDRAPMWATPGTGRVNPFKPAAQPVEESARKSSVDAEAKPSSPFARPKTEDTADRTGIADQSDHRSAFFDRATTGRSSEESKTSTFGDMTRPSGKGKAPHAPTVGMSLEGKSSSILNNGARPTATEPLPGFKPIDRKDE